jgi:hypothetical protein
VCESNRFGLFCGFLVVLYGTFWVWLVLSDTAPIYGGLVICIESTSFAAGNPPMVACGDVAWKHKLQRIRMPIILNSVRRNTYICGICF